jgi:choline-glycine betaine transporter
MTIFTVIMSMMSVGLIFLGVIEITYYYVKAIENSKESGKNHRNISSSSLLINKHRQLKLK